MLEFADTWFCTESTVLQCYKSFTEDLISGGLLAEKNRKLVGKKKPYLKCVLVGAWGSIFNVRNASRKSRYLDVAVRPYFDWK